MIEEKTNWLARENCNKAMCKTCIFRTDGKALPLRPGRLDAIKLRIATLSSHQCHTTENTCYGALQYQAQIMCGMGFIQEPTVDCFLDTVKEVLNL